MNLPLRKLAIPILRWTLGLVVLLQSIHATLSGSVAHHFVDMGVPAWAGRTLGGTEIAAAILFLVPLTTAVGGYLLVAVFAVAAAIHILHGEVGVSALLVYAAAVLVCIANRRLDSAETPHDR